MMWDRLAAMQKTRISIRRSLGSAHGFSHAADAIWWQARRIVRGYEKGCTDEDTALRGLDTMEVCLTALKNFCK